MEPLRWHHKANALNLFVLLNVKILSVFVTVVLEFYFVLFWK